jgi:hypothetical protein
MSITMDYSNVSANNDSYDAFTACCELTVNGAAGHDIKLTRPFAQINFGTEDYAQAVKTNMTVKKSAFKVRPYQTLNLWTGDVSNQATEYVTFALDTIPMLQGAGETFPIEGFDYIGMNYILAPKDKETTDFYFLIDENQQYELHCPNIPIQRNYRTNIYGNLFTCPNNFFVYIDPVYETDEYEEEVQYETWDGSISEDVEPTADGKYHIYYGSQLANIFQQADYGYNFEGDVIVLENNLDMGGFEWTPIGAYGDGADWDFRGTFDGQGHTIKNFCRTGNSVPNAGLFGITTNATIRNLILEDVKVIHNTNGNLPTGVLLGWGTNTKVSNITVKGHIEVEGNHYVGGVIGCLDSSSEVSNITVEADNDSYVLANCLNSQVSCGGVIGYSDRCTKFENITSNINVTATNATNHVAHVGGILGYSYSSGVFTNCTATGNVTLNNVCESTATPNPYTMTIGGIVGSQSSNTGITFNNCSFSGELKSYSNDEDVTATVKENNSYWESCGWFHISGTSTPYVPTSKINVN